MARRSRTIKDYSWPSWRYGPDGESAIFKCAEDVPIGWVRRPGDVEEAHVLREPVRLDREALLKELQDKGIIASSKWSSAYIQELVNNGMPKP